MLYRRSDVEIGFYEYDRWVEPPEEMVTRVVISMVRASGLFRQVVSANNVQLPAWILNGEVVRFDEVREGGSRRAECWVRVELHRASDDHLLWAKSFRAAVPLVMKTPQAFAQAMSHAVQHVALQLIASLEEANPPHLQEKQH